MGTSIFIYFYTVSMILNFSILHPTSNYYTYDTTMIPGTVQYYRYDTVNCKKKSEMLF